LAWAPSDRDIHNQGEFGWFGGQGFEGAGQFFSSVGLNSGYLMPLLAGAANFFCGLALMVGLLV